MVLLDQRLHLRHDVVELVLRHAGEARRRAVPDASEHNKDTKLIHKPKQIKASQKLLKACNSQKPEISIIPNIILQYEKTSSLINYNKKNN